MRIIVKGLPLFATIFLILILASRPQFSSAQSAAASPDLAITNARIYPDPQSDPIDNGTVLISHGRITWIGKTSQARIPAGIRKIDASGMVLVPGFWNCHVHLIEAKWTGADTADARRMNQQLADMLTSHGFTHVFDLAELDTTNEEALRRRIISGELAGPAILRVGIPFTPPGGSPFYIAPAKLPEIGTPDSAAAYVKSMLNAGMDGIKIWSASPDGQKVVPMPLAIAKAAVAMAHSMGKPVFAHPTSLAGVRIAVESGVDILAHVAPDDIELLPRTLMDSMIRQKMALIPTLNLYKWELQRQNLPIVNSPLINTATGQLNEFSKAGGEILFGTDVGYVTEYSTLEEFGYMGQAGLDYKQILTSLTIAPSKRFGLSKKTGRIAPGMDADLVLLSADPAKDVKAFAQVSCTIREGRFIYSDAAINSRLSQ